MQKVNLWQIIFQVSSVILLALISAYVALSVTPVELAEKVEESISNQVKGAVDDKSDLTDLEFTEAASNVLLTAASSDKVVFVENFANLTEPKGTNLINIKNKSLQDKFITLRYELPTQIAKDVVVEVDYAESEFLGDHQFELRIPANSKITLKSVITPLTDINFPVVITYILE